MPPERALRAIRGCSEFIAVLAEHQAYALGRAPCACRGTWGQTGQSHTDNICQPRLVGGALEGQQVVQVAAGGRHTLCLGADNQLFGFGEALLPRR